MFLFFLFFFFFFGHFIPFVCVCRAVLECRECDDPVNTTTKKPFLLFRAGDVPA
jgi:hypothetical protein